MENQESKNNMNDPNYERLFDCACEWLLSDGGDGYSLIICRSKSAKEVADMFEKWQTFSWSRTDHENGSISFGNDNAFTQEQGICFIPGPDMRSEVPLIGKFLSDRKSDYILNSYIFVI